MSAILGIPTSLYFHAAAPLSFVKFKVSPASYAKYLQLHTPESNWSPNRILQAHSWILNCQCFEMTPWFKRNLKIDVVCTELYVHNMFDD